MPLFRSKPKVIDAEQYLPDQQLALVRGVHPANLHPIADQPYVITAQGQRVFVQPGEWIVDEGDGVHFYPIADAIFKGPKGYDPLPMATSTLEDVAANVAEAGKKSDFPDTPNN